jgi:hypothetical protein
MTSAGADAQPPSALEDDLIEPLIAELAGKSDLVWVQVSGQPARPLWSVWHDDAIAVVTGGIEQPDPGLADGGTATVILRSKENRARQLSLTVTAQLASPASETWDAAVRALHPKRLNAPDGEEQPNRWARESQIWLLTPTGEVSERPGAQSDHSQRAEPMETPATTLTRKPFHAGRATKKRR